MPHQSTVLVGSSIDCVQGLHDLKLAFEPDLRSHFQSEHLCFQTRQANGLVSMYCTTYTCVDAAVAHQTFCGITTIGGWQPLVTSGGGPLARGMALQLASASVLLHWLSHF